MATKIYFSGQVQGVGFRVTAASIACKHLVKGWVRNMPDGRVELLADGSPVVVEAFLSEIRSRMRQHIQHEELQEVDGDSSLVAFDIVD